MCRLSAYCLSQLCSLANVVSRIASAPAGMTTGKATEPANPPNTPQPNKGTGHAPPAYTLTVPGSLDTTNLGLSERQIKKQGLECLVAILKSLVAWGTVANKAPESTEPTTRSRTSEDVRADTLTPDPSRDRLSLAYTDVAQPSPITDAQDDPMRFENAKQKKTTLVEGIKRFNSKPKKVC
jgi:brefeldin A-inhibited guanine nucleotide-exchange protein